MSPSVTPATRNEGGCHQAPRLSEGGCRQVPRLPRKWNVNVTKCTPAPRSEGVCRQVPRLPRKVARRPGRLKRAQAHRQSQPSAISTTPATQSEGGCPQVPRMPRETKVDGTKCHACHAKYHGIKDSV